MGVEARTALVTGAACRLGRMEQVAQQGSPHHTEVRTHGGATQPVANPLEADIVAATEAGATMGEMAGVLRMAYGQPADPFGLLEDPI